MSNELTAEPRDPATATSSVNPRHYTHAEVCAEFSENSQRGELWDGTLVMSPSPSFFHQEVLLRFYRQLHEWVTSRALGKVITAPTDMVLSEQRVTQPDVVFVSRERFEIAIYERGDILKRIVSGRGAVRLVRQLYTLITFELLSRPGLQVHPVRLAVYLILDGC